MHSRGHPPEHSKSKCQKYRREDEISQGTHKKAASSGRGDVATEEETVHSGRGDTKMDDALGVKEQVSSMH